MKTKRDALRAAFWVLSATALFYGTAQAQDFQRSYHISADGSVRVVTISGNIRVQGYEGSDVIIEGTRSGRDREIVDILDRSTPDHVNIGVRYPERGGGNASVDFVVKAPRNIRFNYSDISSVSGNVSLMDVIGNIRARSISGSVEIRNVSGIVSADSVSGNVMVDLNKVAGEGDMRFQSISGNVSVRAPANLSGYVDMKSLTGALTTDFPIEIQEHRYVPGRSARGRLGTGTSNILISSVSGRVSLLKN